MVVAACDVEMTLRDELIPVIESPRMVKPSGPNPKGKSCGIVDALSAQEPLDKALNAVTEEVPDVRDGLLLKGVKPSGPNPNGKSFGMVDVATAQDPLDEPLDADTDVEAEDAEDGLLFKGVRPSGPKPKGKSAGTEAAVNAHR